MPGFVVSLSYQEARCVGSGGPAADGGGCDGRPMMAPWVLQIDYKERPSEALIREMEEEVGIKVNLLSCAMAR